MKTRFLMYLKIEIYFLLRYLCLLWLTCSLCDKVKNENFPLNPSKLKLNFQEKFWHLNQFKSKMRKMKSHYLISIRNFFALFCLFFFFEPISLSYLFK